MSEYPLQSFIDLINFDHGTYAIRDEIRKISEELESIKKTRDELKLGLKFVENKVTSARKEVDQSELEMKDLEQKEIEKKEKMEKSQSAKEYKLFSKEIKALKKKQHDYEETLLFAWNKFERAKKEFDEQKEQLEAKVDGMENSFREKELKLKDLKNELNERDILREEKRKKVPKEWLEKYVSMSSRVSNPVVPVLGGSCSACFYHLPPQDFLALKRSKILQCKGCYRFLYVERSDE